MYLKAAIGGRGPCLIFQFPLELMQKTLTVQLEPLHILTTGFPFTGFTGCGIQILQRADLRI
jgi:hypothetical protein